MPLLTYKCRMRFARDEIFLEKRLHVPLLAVAFYGEREEGVSDRKIGWTALLQLKSGVMNCMQDVHENYGRLLSAGAILVQDGMDGIKTFERFEDFHKEYFVIG